MNDNVVTTLYHLYLADEPLTTTELAKEVFGPEGTGEVQNADRKIRYYLEDSHSHLVEEEANGEGSKRFKLADDMTWFGLGEINIWTAEEDEISKPLGRTLVYRDEEGEPHVLSIEVGEEGEFGGKPIEDPGL